MDKRPYKRTAQQVIQKVSGDFPILFVMGPRQVGKTTLLQMCADENHNYVTLDNLGARSLAQQDPALLIQKYSAPAIIGEIQYAPELLSEIKKLSIEQRTMVVLASGIPKVSFNEGHH